MVPDESDPFVGVLFVKPLQPPDGDVRVEPMLLLKSYRRGSSFTVLDPSFIPTHRGNNNNTVVKYLVQ